MLVGSNLAWCHPVLYQRILAAKSLRPHMKIVVIDPRRTASAEAALHLPIRPDGDVALFVGLLNYLAEKGFLASNYVESHTTGVAEALAIASAWDIPEMSIPWTVVPGRAVLPEDITRSR